MSGITLEKFDRVGIITIDRPDKLNSLTLAMYQELGAAFAEVGEDDSLSVAILTGAGSRAFCVGADLGESIPALAEGRFDISEWDGAHQKHSTLDKPVICAINGLCLGGGFEIMLSTDIRIAADNAQFSLPETGIGVVPAGGTLVRLVRQIPYAFAMDLMLRGGRLGAEDALRYGLVNRVVPAEDLDSTVWALARELCRRSSTAMGVVKRAVRELRDLQEDEAFHREAELGQAAFMSDDAREGLASFAQRRAPDFPSAAADDSAGGRRRGLGHGDRA